MTESTEIETEADENQDDSTEHAEASDEKPKRPRRKKAATGDEPEDEMSAKALSFVTDVVHHMGMDCSVELLPPKNEDDRDIRIEVSGPDAGHIIGKKGQTLSALQFLANRSLNRPGTERRYVSVDAEGYRSRRDDSLAAMATRLAEQAVADGKIITFEPMSPRDRRIVHMALVEIEGVVTKSDGEADDRRVQIIPVRKD